MNALSGVPNLIANSSSVCLPSEKSIADHTQALSFPPWLEIFVPGTTALIFVQLDLSGSYQLVMKQPTERVGSELNKPQPSQVCGERCAENGSSAEAY